MKIVVKKTCNLAIGVLVKKNQNTICLDIFNKLNEVLVLGNYGYGYYPEINVLLWNNFGCVYKRMDRNDLAMKYYEKAL